MITRFEQLADRVQTLCHKFGDKKLNEWCDNQDVCLMLRISPRTLQTLRDNGTLPYTQINRKLYYKSQDVQNVIKSNHLK
jgi:hypothetical protein